MNHTIQLLMFSVVGTLIVEILLILTSIKWLYNIWVNSKHIAKSTKDFPSIFTKDIEEVKLLHQELKELININAKKEKAILQGVFLSEEIKIHIKMLLSEIRNFKKWNQLSSKQETSNNENN